MLLPIKPICSRPRKDGSSIIFIQYCYSASNRTILNTQLVIPPECWDNRRLFYSEGPQGVIRKIVEFYRLPNLKTEVYNLSFGDWDEVASKLNDKTVTNNGDRDKVLATVSLAVLDFISSHPNASIFAAGNTPARNRLYQMGISRVWEEIDDLFEVRGYVNGEWLPFERGISYTSFLLHKR